jgi:hypothetical protein
MVHTGFRGAGPYGGNRIPVAGLPLLAARLTRLVFHTGETDGSQLDQQARRTVQQGVESGAQGV